MASHPTGITVDIVGTNTGDRGRSCKEHSVCGCVLDNDVVVRIRKVQVEVDGHEELALAAYWVSDGIDRCRVGFLPRQLLKHHKQYNGKLAQIIEKYEEEDDSPTKRCLHHRNRGHCIAAIIDTVWHNEEPPKKKQKKNDNEEEERDSSEGY